MTDPTTLIPHRPPFLLVDEILELAEDHVVARKHLAADDPLLRQVYPGHYPQQPITPGVLLCEMIFQAGAALMSHRLGDYEGTPVLARINEAKFRRVVHPGETVELRAEFSDQVGKAVYMKGTAAVDGQTAVQVRFTCALTDKESA